MNEIPALSDFIVKNVINNDDGVPMIIITDKSRGTAKYKLPTGEIIIDNGLNQFAVPLDLSVIIIIGTPSSLFITFLTIKSDNAGISFIIFTFHS